MAVQRKIDETNYAFDGQGKSVPAGKRSFKVSTTVRRSYPIDKYDVPESIVTSPLVTRLRILKVPLLGQGGYKGNWCGRTSMSMAYNWFELLKESDPKSGYITHWDAGDPSYKLNLRHHDKTRAFTQPKETAPRDTTDHGYGRFADTVNEVFGKAYETEARNFLAIEPYVEATSASRAARLSAFRESEIEKKLEPVVQAIDLNNPVFMYSGLTKGCNHLILLVGYVYILENGVENLWMAVADPSTERWLQTIRAGSQQASNVLDLTKGAKGPKRTLDDIAPSHDLVYLIDGDWCERRGTLSLVRASFFFRPKKDVEAIKRLSGAGDFAKFSSKNALVMDDVGNPRPGGVFILSTDAKHQKTPEGAVIARSSGCVFPVDLPGLADCPIPVLHRIEMRDPKQGGAYPLGRYQNLHGGVHYPAPDGTGDGHVALVRAIAPGRVVAARSKSVLPKEPNEKKSDELVEAEALAKELAGNSRDFVLVRHELEIADPARKKAKADLEHLVFYSLYMHLSDPDGFEAESNLHDQVRWLKALVSEQHGSLTLIDGEGRFVLDGAPATPDAGARFFPKKRPPVEVSEGSFDLVVLTKGQPAKLEVGPPPAPAEDDGRVRLVGKAPDPGLGAALLALTKGDLVTFPEPHRHLAVDTGTPIGLTHKQSAVGEGFLHWELLAPKGGGIARLARLAAEVGLDIFRAFEEKPDKNNNFLDPEEDADLRSALPEEDKKPPKDMRDLRGLSFAGAVDEPLEADHYALTLRVGNLEGMVDEGECELLLSFEGAGHEPQQQPVKVEVVKGEAELVVSVPAWAHGVLVTAPNLMVRERPAVVSAKALGDHMKRIASHRLRNVLLTHLNEWCEQDMLEVVRKRYKEAGGAPTLEKAVRALSWWGAKETTLYSDKKLFGGALPAATAIDNIHPVVGLWLLDALLERGAIGFVSDAPGAKPLYAGFLPAVGKRPPLPAGASVSVAVVADAVGASTVLVRADAVSTSDAHVTMTFGTGTYSGDLYRGTAELSGWGEFKLAVHHTTGGKPTEEKPLPLGAATLSLDKPVCADICLGPHRESGGEWTWDVDFADNLPERLHGYLVAFARLKTDDDSASFDLRGAALPVAAGRLEADELGVYQGGYLVGPPKARNAGGVAVVPGLLMREIEAAKDPKLPLKVARGLLVAFAALQATYAANVPGGDLVLVERSLAESGTAVGVSATAKRVRGKLRTLEDNNETLLDIAGAMGLQVKALPDGAERPHHLELSVAAPEEDETPGGILRVGFDPRPLFGAVLAEMRPGKDDVEICLGLRFYNGGHVIHHEVANETDQESGVLESTAALVGVDFGALTKDMLEIRAEGPHATVALPRIEEVVHSLEAGCVVFTAKLLGGGRAFWKAASPAFVVNGRTVKGSVKQVGRTSAREHQLRARCPLTGKDKFEGPLSAHAVTLTTAEWGEASFAAGSVRSEEASYDATPVIEDVKVVRDTGNRLVVTATARGLPAPFVIHVDALWNGKNQVGRTIRCHPVTAYVGKTGTYLVADAKGHVEVRLEARRWLKGAEPRKLEVKLSRPATTDPKKPVFAAGVSATGSYDYP